MQRLRKPCNGRREANPPSPCHARRPRRLELLVKKGTGKCRRSGAYKDAAACACVAHMRASPILGTARPILTLEISRHRTADQAADACLERCTWLLLRAEASTFLQHLFVQKDGGHLAYLLRALSMSDASNSSTPAFFLTSSECSAPAASSTRELFAFKSWPLRSRPT